jgi:hypothetical protein
MCRDSSVSIVIGWRMWVPYPPRSEIFLMQLCPDCSVANLLSYKGLYPQG